MSSSRRRDTRAVGVGWDDERVRRMFPPALMKSRSTFGVNCGPRPIRIKLDQPDSAKKYKYRERDVVPFDFGGRMSRWS